MRPAKFLRSNEFSTSSLDKMIRTNGSTIILSDTLIMKYHIQARIEDFSGGEPKSQCLVNLSARGFCAKRKTFSGLTPL